MDVEAWRRNTMAQDAVERNFEKIGEALKRLRRSDPDLAKRVPHIKRIIDFRNLFAHGYDVVDIMEVWAITKKHLPALRQTAVVLRTELESMSAGPKEPPDGSGEFPSGPSSLAWTRDDADEVGDGEMD